jgi:hypothetical protein
MTESDARWNAIRQSETENAVTRNRLSAKSGLDDEDSTWSPAKWEERLEAWEFHYMVSDSFDALCNQGGLIHAFHCFFDNPANSDAFIDESKVMASWTALESSELPKLYRMAKEELQRFGRDSFDDLEPEEEEELEEFLDEAWIGGGTPIEIRLAEYAKNNTGEVEAPNPGHS